MYLLTRDSDADKITVTYQDMDIFHLLLYNILSIEIVLADNARNVC